MALDAVSVKSNYQVSDSVESYVRTPVFEKWRNFPVSRISHHGKACCEIALEWLYAMDFSQLNGGSVLTGPRWIRQRYDWGPTRWQIHWCEAIERKALDCGAQAALAHEVFRARGVKSFQVQLVQQYSKDAAVQWSKRWNSEETSVHWINEDVIYHEGCAVLFAENKIKIWDASAAWWIRPQQFGGYGSLLALRLLAQKNAFAHFDWGSRRFIANQWQEI